MFFLSLIHSLGPNTHIQDPRQVDERRQGHSIRAIGSSMSQQHRCRDPQCVHRGGYVCDPIETKARHRKGLPRGHQQGHQGLCQVQLNSKIHDL